MTPEIQDKFFKENGIAIDDAISHIKQWTNEGNFDSAENGLSELKKFLGDSEEVKSLEKEIFEKKNSQKNEVQTPKKTETSENQTEDKSEKLIAALSYASYLVIIPLLLKRDSALCQHHGKQGLIFVVIFFMFNIIGSIIYGIGVIISLVQIAIAIYGGMKAYKGEMWVAPFIGDAAKKINFN